MRTFLRRLGTALLFLLVGLCFVPSVVPPFLDRIYYRGPASGHFDGERFFNPEDRLRPPPPPPARFLNRWVTRQGRAQWPEHVTVPTYSPPPASGACPGSSTNGWIACKVVENSGAMFVTWVGHSTVLVQVNGLNILTDPIWSERASPVSFIGPKRVRAPGIPFERLPPIDLVLVSHNHYDHMDIPTLKRLWDRDRPLIVTGLGNDALLRRAGIPAQAGDWGQTIRHARFCAASIDPCQPGAIEVTVERVHHWGSRWGVDRNRALWSGFTVRLPRGNLFFAGDTGWGDGSWLAEAARHGPYRLAILPIGAYAPREVMQGSHMNPEEAVAAFQALGARTALGVHWGTFQLTFEAIDEPPRRLAAALKAKGIAPDRFVASEVGTTFVVP
jgi:L-ascorbate metabolism protein UlaG (beta-lactamase superfamily)